LSPSCAANRPARFTIGKLRRFVSRPLPGPAAARPRLVSGKHEFFLVSQLRIGPREAEPQMINESRVPGSPAIQAPPGAGDGVFYIGRPEWLTEEWLSSLRREAAAARSGAIPLRTEFFAPVGPAGRAFSTAPELLALIAARAVPAAPSGSASYLYYDQPGSELGPHLDDERFVLNVLMNLEHHFESTRCSAFLLFPHGPAPIKVFLDPGMFILFHAGAVIHARSRVSGDGREHVWNIGTGFAPLAPLLSTRYWRPNANGTGDD